ncbi:unnamed protein product, partial [Rotaria sp. Silwood1]
MESARR